MRVNFAVWSVANDQDDLIWYSGNKESSTIWKRQMSAIATIKQQGRIMFMYMELLMDADKFGKLRLKFQTQKGREVRNYNESKGSFDVIVKQYFFKIRG